MSAGSRRERRGDSRAASGDSVVSRTRTGVGERCRTDQRAGSGHDCCFARASDRCDRCRRHDKRHRSLTADGTGTHKAIRENAEDGRPARGVLARPAPCPDQVRPCAVARVSVCRGFVADRVPEAWRPRFHVTGERNWINDPNGPIRHEGVYHLFYQANLDAPSWGRPVWGHVTSTDLVTWTRRPVALSPEPGAPDADGCWSGCTRIVQGRPAIYYTGVVGEDDGRVESVCRAWGSADLLAWERDTANPLVLGPPPQLCSGYHRDPFLWQDDDGWHMLLGGGTSG